MADANEAPRNEIILKAEQRGVSSETIIRELRRGDDASAFRTLNEEWIARYFTLEEHDRKQLENPDAILGSGGHIYIAVSNGETIGCVALIPMRDGVYELSKMAITPRFQGRGIGRALLLHALAEARAIGARSLFLGSNTILAGAVRLYESVGFVPVPAEKAPTSPYARANVIMELDLG